MITTVARAAALGGLAVLLANCSSGAGGKSAGAPAVPSLAGSDVSSICSYLKSTNVLKEADDLAAGNGDMNKISRVLAEMRQVAANPPPYMQLITSNIVSGLETLSAGSEATQTVLADSRLLAGECRARSLPIPNTD
jgi:hypothetical protein